MAQTIWLVIRLENGTSGEFPEDISPEAWFSTEEEAEEYIRDLGGRLEGDGPSYDDEEDIYDDETWTIYPVDKGKSTKQRRKSQKSPPAGWSTGDEWLKKQHAAGLEWDSREKGWVKKRT